MAVAGLLASPSSVGATPLNPIEVVMLGPDPVRVQVAEGPGLPCDASENHLLIDGKFARGMVIRAQTADFCVCMQHTFGAFSDVEWSLPVRVCRRCVPHGRRCLVDGDPTIRIAIRSDG